MFEAGVPIVRGLATDKRHALKHPLRLAVLADEIKEEVICTGMRMPLVTGILRSLAPIERRIGYRTEYNASFVVAWSTAREMTSRSRVAASILLAGAVLGLWWLNHPSYRA